MKLLESVMAKKAAPRPECLADTLLDEAAVQELLDAAIDGQAFLASLYKMTGKEIEKVDMRRASQGATSLAVKNVALALHNKMVKVATSVGARPSDIFRFGKGNLGVLGSTADTLIQKITMHADAFQKHGLSKTEAVGVVLKQNMMPHHTRGTEEAIIWLKDLVEQDTVRPSGTLATFIGTYFSNARLGPDARQFMEQVAVLHKQRYGKPPSGLARVSKIQREATLMRLRKAIAEQSAATPRPKPKPNLTPAPKKPAVVRTKKPAKEKPVWKLIEGADEEFLLVAPSRNCVAPPSTRLTKRNGRILRYLITKNTLASDERATAQAELGIVSEELFDYALQQTLNVVRDLRRRTPGQPALIINKPDSGTLMVVGTPAYIKRGPTG